ncbi:MAG: HD domain-containing protein [Lachnospiraceae bacterium]|nr:HD domain-containing protein [Candidatus Merdinaster equi]
MELFNIDYETSAAILTAFIFVFHCMKYSAETRVNKEFRGMVFVVFMCNFMDALTGYLSNCPGLVPLWLDNALTTIFFITPITMTMCLARYALAYIYENIWDSILLKCITVVYVLDIFAIILNLFTHWLYYYDEAGNYTRGPLYIMCYALPFVIMLIVMVFVVRRHRYYSRGQFFALIFFNLICLITASLQFLFFSNILLTYFVAAVCVLNMFFFLETPDYQKMVKTMADLEYLQKNLRDEVKKQTAVADERREKVEQMSLQMVQTLATTIDAKDRYTNGHSTRVAYYSVLLARELGWNDDEINALRYKGLLHDIGKIGVADVILNKPSRLKKVEYEVIQSHTVVGYEILRDSSFLPGSELVARYHHEKYDGSGYPDGLKGEEIPPQARVVAIADAYDAMNSDRVYRKALSKDIIRKELIEGKGKQFDPAYLEAFLRLFDAGRLDMKGDEMEIKQDDNSGKLMRKVMESMQKGGQDNADFISGVLRRETGEDLIMVEMSRGEGALMLLEVCNLKTVNEKSGRIVGDKAISEIGRILNDCGDEIIASRNGGSQFLCYFVDVNEIETCKLCDRIFAAFENVKDQDVRLSPITLHAGLCLTSPEDDYFDVYSKADKALYHILQSKNAGYYFYKYLESGLGKSDAELSRLVEGLKNNQPDEVMDVEYDDFTRFYGYIMNLWKRYNHAFSLAMISINQLHDTQRDYESMEKAISCMEMAVKRTIRTVDVCTRYSSSQLLIILLEVKENEVTPIIKRIFQDYYKIYTGAEMEVSYEVADLNLLEDKL